MSQFTNTIKEFVTRYQKRDSIATAISGIANHLEIIDGQLCKISTQLDNQAEQSVQQQQTVPGATVEQNGIGAEVGTDSKSSGDPWSQLKCYEVEGVLLAVPEAILSDKFHSDLVTGTYENRELAPIRANLKPDDIVLELGAAVGFISTYVAKLLDQGRVISYEANSEMLPVAANNHRLNDVHVDLHHALVSGDENTEEKEFYVDRTFFWDSGVVPRAHNNGSVREKIVVSTKALSRILSEVDPTVIIIDIEGGEAGLFENVKSLGRVRQIFMGSACIYWSDRDL